MIKYFKLVDKMPVPAGDIMEWGEWFENADRRVARTKIGDRTVSTVFVGIDQSYGESEKPLVFETMTFGDGAGEEIRTATWEEAEAAHQIAVEAVTTGET